MDVGGTSPWTGGIIGVRPRFKDEMIIGDNWGQKKEVRFD